MIIILIDMHNNGNMTSNGVGGNTMSAPIINIQHPAPPAISVVTFRWDSIKDTRGAPDR